MHYREAESEGRARAERQWKLLHPLLERALEASGEFRERLRAAGLSARDLDSPEGLALVPPLRKKDLIRLQEERGLDWLLTCEPGRLRRIYMSPGPIFDPEGQGPDHWGWAEAFYAAGFRAGDLVQMTFSYHLTPAGLMLEEPLRAIGCCVIPAGPGNTQVQIDLLRRLPVTGFVGMASYLKTIGQKAREQGLDPRRDFRLRTAFVAAEKLTEALRAEVEEMFGIVVRQGYGTADVGAIAYECAERNGMHASTRCVVEICDPATGRALPPGETGEVVVTALTPEYPLIRLATGDLSRFLTDPCPCGRTALRLDGILGRADDTAKVKGQFIYPSQAARVMAQFPQIQGWQIVVENPGGRDEIFVRLCLAGELDEGAFAAAFQNEMKLRPGLRRLKPGELAGDAPKLVDRRSFGA